MRGTGEGRATGRGVCGCWVGGRNGSGGRAVRAPVAEEDFAVHHDLLDDRRGRKPVVGLLGWLGASWELGAWLLEFEEGDGPLLGLGPRL